METMARRIVEKLLHPIYKALQERAPIDFEASKQSYKEQYLDKNPQRVADHVDTDS
jgi:precorrin-2 methylase